jgi:hypothetical protein
MRRKLVVRYKNQVSKKVTEKEEKNERKCCFSPKKYANDK